jgi:hypothetical protein
MHTNQMSKSKEFQIMIHLHHPCREIDVVRDEMTKKKKEDLENQGYIEINDLRKEMKEK